MKMPFELAEVTSYSDFDQLIPVLWNAYASPRVPLLWLTFAVTDDTPDALAEGMSASQKAFMHAHKDDPTSHYLKVTNAETRTIIAGSRWHIHAGNVAEGDPKPNSKASLSLIAWPEGDKRDFASQVLEQSWTLRKQRYKGPNIGLEMIFVHPDHRNRGAGKLMMEWGIRKANELGLPCFLESTPSAVPFFESLGFKVVKVDVTNVHRKDASEEWKFMQRKFELTFSYAMWRPAQGKFVPGVTKMPF